MKSGSSILNAFTVDVEDYYHVSAFSHKFSYDEWEHFPSRVVDNTHRLLKILERHSVHGTFFVLGWVARKFPQLIREIQRGGHEIGCHSFWHRLIYDLHPDEFRRDLREGRDELEQVLGTAVLSHRAPSFSITSRSLWALEILVQEGFQIDSSIFTVRHDRYGLKNAERFAHLIETPDGALWEFPPAIYRLWKWNLPVSGGGYFRLYPAGFSAFCLRQSNLVHHHPFVFYIHPWELDPEQPRIPSRMTTRFRHYVNLSRTEHKLDMLFRQFSFGTLSEALRDHERRWRSDGKDVKRIDLRDELRGPLSWQVQNLRRQHSSTPHNISLTLKPSIPRDTSTP
ncbi:MAG: XrtA system polysaccharide deacetylase [Planctomycetaceae bacterium]